MLSSAKIGRSSWRYYQRTVAGGACEYYSARGDTPGRWHGSGLVALGLTPDAIVAERELEALFGRGLSPTSGKQLGASWAERSVTGYDLTFSAPKSVSALWALGDQQWVREVEAAHTAAVKAALGYLEGVASWSRRGRNGIDQIATGGFAAALFNHGTSRTGDPQLHTHALVVNKVLCADGAWRTLDGHEIYHHKKAAGTIYQAALRAELTARLPVVFGPVSEHGQAEITGVPAELMQAWSKRTTAVLANAVPTIAQAEEALDRPVTAAERARIIKTAVLATRPAKEHHAADSDRKSTWTTQAAELGWTAYRLTGAVTEATEQVTPCVVIGSDGRVIEDETSRVSAPVTGVIAVSIAPGVGAEPAPRRLDRAQLLAAAVTAVGRSKAVWSAADLTVAVAARIDRLDEPLPGSAQAVTQLITDLVGTALGRDNAETNLVPEVAAMTQAGAVPLGADLSGDTARASDPRYASAELLDRESRIIHTVGAGRRDGSPKPMSPAMTQAVTHAAVGLSPDQVRAVTDLVGSRDQVVVMTAPAGSGKTTTIAAAVHAWTSAGVDVTLLAPSARAAAELSTAAGARGLAVRGQTVARWLLTQRNTERDTFLGSAQASAQPRVVLVDEASMLNTRDLHQLFREARRARIVLVGDPAQIGAVNAAGGMFAYLADFLGDRRVELNELHRFTHPWEADASLQLRAGDRRVLTTYAEHDRIHPEVEVQAAADAVFHRWQQTLEASGDGLMLATSWTDVAALNARARAAAIATGTVHGPDLAVIPTVSASSRGHVEDRTYRAGDLLIAKRNAAAIQIGGRGLRNGDRLRVLAWDEAGLLVRDVEDGASTVLPRGYLARHVEYGWASTIDGAQGATADVAVLLARPGLDREHLYVAMTRGRRENHVHTTTEVDTGDAGNHRHPSGPTAADQGRPVADQDEAIRLLTRALATTGAGEAAHSYLRGLWYRTTPRPVPGDDRGRPLPAPRSRSADRQVGHDRGRTLSR